MIQKARSVKAAIVGGTRGWHPKDEPNVAR